MATKVKTLKKKSSKLAVQSENEQGEKRSKSVKKNLVQDEENAKDNTGKENPDAGESRSKKKKQPGQSGAQTPSPSLSAEEQKRGQFRKNIVSPVHPDQQGSRASLQSRASARQDGSNMGSAISVQSHLSHTSVREAWTDNSDVENGPTPQPRPGSAATVNSSVVSLREGSNRRLSGVREDSMVVAKPEQHAYIPYLYARKSIVKIMNDMENMKQNHIEIVGQIEIQYKSIETETQSQFNTFVICLRQQYYEKVENFRQIINAHKEEIEKKEAYWNSTLASLVVRNNELLRDKKHLYIQSKEEIERLEQEKTILREELINKLGLAQADLSSVEEKSAEEYRKLSEENKILNDQLENEKAEVEKLKTLVAKQAVGQTSSTVVEKVTTAPLLAAAVVSDDNEEERQKMEEERRAMSEERMRWDVERNQFAEEKKNWLNELNKLQGNISAEAVECAEWRAKYDSLKTQLQDMADLQANYHALECQYAALGTLVASSENSKQAAEENAKKTEAEKIMMEEEKRKMEADILKWEKEFKKKHKREPVDEDKSDMVKEMYIQNEELETMVTSLDTKLQTYNQVEDGKVPEAPMVQPVPLVIKDPEIKIVEVKVPDPTVVAALEKIQAENTALLAQITALNQKNSQLQEEITRQTTEITQLGNTITTLEAAASAGGISTVGVDQEVHALLVAQVESKDKNISDLEHRLEEKDEELDQMKKTHREMQKDMKKMIKEQIKLQMKADAAGGNEESQKMLLIIVGAVRKVEEEDQETAKKLAKQLEAAEKKLKEAKDAQVSHQKAVDSSEAKHGKKSVKDRDAETKKLYKDLNSSTKQVEEAELEVSALKLLITGDVSIVKKPVTDTKATPDEAAVANLEQQLSAVDDRIAELEMENDALKDEKNNLSIKIKDLEQKLEQAKVQTQLQVTAAPPVSVFSEGDEELSEQITDLQKQVDSLEAALLQEKSAHDNTRDELDNVRKQLDLLKEEFSNHKVEMDAEFDVKSQSLKSDIMAKEEELKKLRERNEEIEQERLANVPVDTAKEIKNLRNKLTNAEKEKTGTASASHMLQSQIKELETKLALANKNLEAQRASNRDMEAKLKNGRFEKEKALKDLAVQIEKKEQQRTIEDKRRITSLEKMVKESQSAGPKVAAVGAVKGGAVAGADKNLRDQLAAAKRENNELNTRIKQLEAEIKRIGQKDADQAIQDKSVTKKHEKILKELIGKLEIEKSKVERTEGALATTQNDLKETKKLLNEKEREAMKLTADLAVLGETAKVGLEAAARVKVLESESKRLIDENAVLTENYNSERVLRKKYYNMVEDMKGKIRVYCRSRPLSKTELQNGNSCVVRSPDEYSVVLSTQRGEREFQFDQIFMDDSTQEKVFEDTNNLVQSAVDGYNVCIFAYGQTGSGKTFTMIGDKEQRFPGIAPRAFNRIFELTAELKKKMTIEISTYMMELYNDHLIDLFCRPGAFDESKLDIKKDKKGLVYVSGAVIKQASSAKELFALFEEGSKNRHTASTKMNDESSRSHLVVSVIMECTNIATGQVTRGKLSLVDLAGSERVGKTGATADQLKEAMSINKSLSALGDVISALSSEQQFIPYRNNKLTMLMQDSLGGNAKTLMFVNISPADYNVDESVISLTYASRVKLITNDASKNAENKEIARLKSIIAKLKRGEDGSDAEED